MSGSFGRQAVRRAKVERFFRARDSWRLTDVCWAPVKALIRVVVDSDGVQNLAEVDFHPHDRAAGRRMVFLHQCSAIDAKQVVQRAACASISQLRRQLKAPHQRTDPADVGLENKWELELGARRFDLANIICESCFPVYARRLASVVHLCDLTDAEDQVGVASEHQALKVTDLLPVLLLRRAEDALPKVSYPFGRRVPVEAGPKILRALCSGCGRSVLISRVHNHTYLSHRFGPPAVACF